MDTLRHFAHVLNNYANLLLAALTASYVWLTWRNLKALQRASLREPELRHLDDIKCNVARPLIDWLDSTAVKILTGSYPPIIVTNVPVQRPKVLVGERTYDYERQLQCQPLNPPAVHSSLYSHSRQAHFPSELARLDAFVAKERQLLSDWLDFARGCADEIARWTTLPRRAASDNIPDSADSDTLVEVCMRDALLGKASPEISLSSPAPGILHVDDGYVGRRIGKGASALTQAWVEHGVGRFRDRWGESGLRERIDALLQEATSVRAALERIEFTQALPHGCEYVGGKGPGVFKRSWHWLRSHHAPSTSWKEISRGFASTAALVMKTLKLGTKNSARFLVRSRQALVRGAHWTQARIAGNRKESSAENKNDASLPRPRLPL